MPRTTPHADQMPRIAMTPARRNRFCYDVSSPEARRIAEVAAAERTIEHYDRRVDELETASRRATIFATTALIAGAAALIGFCVLASTVYASPALAAVIAVATSTGFGVTWVCAPKIT